MSPHLETRWTPVNKLHSLVIFDRSDGSIDVFRNHIAAVEKTDSHVLPLPRVTPDHLAGGLKASFGDLIHGDSLMVCLIKE